jgi:hypothetical protein
VSVNEDRPAPEYTVRSETEGKPVLAQSYTPRLPFRYDLRWCVVYAQNLGAARAIQREWVGENGYTDANR